MSPRRLAGLLLLLAGAFILMGVITAETQYPVDRAYSTANNEISDLGATRPPDSVITHPSAEIFNGTMLLAGAMTFVAAVALRLDVRRRALPYVLAAFGIAMFLVGVFPGNNAVTHPVVAMATFLLGGVTCIVSARMSVGPMHLVSVGMGVICLGFLFFAGSFIPMLGDGGTERWIAYPVVLWMVGFGGYLLGGTSAEPYAVTSNDRALVSAASGA